MRIEKERRGEARQGKAQRWHRVLILRYKILRLNECFVERSRAKVAKR